MREERDSDRSVVAGVLARTPGAFEALVQRHQRLVWHLVHRMVQHPEHTRELSQEVFLRVHQRLHQFRFESTLATWIGRIAFSVAKRHLERRQLPLVEPVEGEASPLERVADAFDLEAAMGDAQLLHRMGEAIQALPPLWRTIVTLYHLDELGIGEVSEITGLPAGTVKSHLFRARRRLRDQLETHAGPLP
ncbi:MAG: sigma-70 family RNA polymerase sigma factor [Lysobacter spongiicola]|nr:sigma-70 family RNA polymerase sigma factor [Lysobacter spongiicola]